MKSEFLVSTDDQVSLGIIHEGYPHVNLREAEKERAKKITDREDVDVVEWYLRPQLVEQEKRKSNNCTFTQFTNEVEAFLKVLRDTRSL